MKDQIFDIIIVGGGIVGAATFYRIQQHHPELKIALLEKENRLAAHQTGHNSGVLHSGLYYKPGSLKAKNCVQGRKDLVAFAKENHIPHDVCGKVVVATEQSELPYLEKIYNTGLQNGLTGIEKINSAQIKEREPYCEGISGLFVPDTGIIDFVKATEKMVEIAVATQPESKLMLSTEAQDFNKEG
ncbi:MAG TPA: FAD-dependent oxidoreductase, partial [Ginsengibacter sp.]|nr:FAD-dependent oxidoreductase [Ginsengibacter sp.]